MLRLTVSASHNIRLALLPSARAFQITQPHRYGTKAYYADPNGPNFGLIQALKRNLDEEERNPERNMYKVRAFTVAIKILDHLEEPIRSAEDALQIKGIGPGIARRIEKYLAGNDNVPATSTNDGPQRPKDSADYSQIEEAIAEIMKVPGIGVIKARRLAEAGCRSILDLNKEGYRSTLSRAVQVAVDFVHLLDYRITREQSQSVKAAIEKIISSEFEVHIVGSYRRGQATSADIDLLLLHPSFVHVPTPVDKVLRTSSSTSAAKPSRKASRMKGCSDAQLRQETLLLSHVLQPLQDRGIIAGTFLSGQRKWQGIARVPGYVRNETGDVQTEGLHARLVGIKEKTGIFRRMDLTLAPTKSRGAALLALTGDLDFNRHIRALASKMGMLLNESGLWRWRTTSSLNEEYAEILDKEDGSGEKGFWELVASETEEDILTQLGREYIDPDKRNFSFIDAKRKPRRAGGKRKIKVGV